MSKSIITITGAVALLAAPAAAIGGGQPVEGIKYPFAVNLAREYNNDHHCGGILVAPNAVITAAGCVSGRAGFGPLYARIGANDLSVQEESRQSIGVFKSIMHQQTNPYTFPYNIAIQILNRDVDSEFTPIAMDLDNTYEGQEATVLGWGYEQSTGASVGKLREATVDVLTCDANEQYICAGRAGTGVCGGDSGGPLFVGQGADAKAIGVALAAGGPCPSGESQLYTKLAYYKDWINNILEQYPSGIDRRSACSCVEGIVEGSSCKKWGTDQTFCFVLGGDKCPTAKYSGKAKRWYKTDCDVDTFQGVSVTAAELSGDEENLMRASLGSAAAASDTLPLVGYVAGGIAFVVGAVGIVVTLRSGDKKSFGSGASSDPFASFRTQE